VEPGNLRRQRADRCGRRVDDAPPSETRAWVVATSAPVRPGTRLARLWSNESRGCWPVRAPRWPPPRVVPLQLANAEWLLHRCRHCGRWACELRALRDLMEGEAVTVPWAGHIMGIGADAEAYEVAFDGTSLRLRGVRCAGAGVAIWKTTGGGRPRLIARVWLALPEGTTALMAEAHACRLAMQTLGGLGAEIRTARVMGDNPIIINHCGNSRNTRDPEVAEVMDRALTCLAQAGWTLRWSWIDRRANSVAHDTAKVGARRARALYDDPAGPRQGRV